MGESLARELKKYCVDELFDSEVYRALAEAEADESRKRVLLEFSSQERWHYEFWKSLAGECREEAPLWKTKLYLAMRKLLGLTFTLKYLERHERKVLDSYRGIMESIEGEQSRETLKRVIEDEELHERTHLSAINEKIVSYVGFVALGLADAIVEITGVHAGFLGVTSSTLMTGVAGLIVGISAAISMASAAYVQAKHELRASPSESALYTGVAYIIAVVLLAAPYFLTSSMLKAFLASVATGVLMVLGFTFYGSVLQDKEFKREFAETSLLLFATAAATYFIGEAIGSHFGIRGAYG